MALDLRTGLFVKKARDTDFTLDVGCGRSKRGIVGVDIERYPEVDVVCDAHHLPFHSDVFDGCYAYAVLEHVDEPLKVLREINRVLRSRAWFKLLVPTDSRLRLDYAAMLVSFHWVNCWKLYRGMKLGGHKWQYNATSLKKMLNMAGFEVEKVERPAIPFITGRKVGKILSKLKVVVHPYLIMESIKR